MFNLYFLQIPLIDLCKFAPVEKCERAIAAKTITTIQKKKEMW